MVANHDAPPLASDRHGGRPSLDYRIQWLMIVGATSLYVLVFGAFYPTAGRAIAALSALPTLVTAWFLGMRIGLLAAVLATLLNLFLFRVIGQVGWDAQTGTPGTMALFVVGLVVGRMHDLGQALGDEFAKRHQIEAALRESEERSRQLADAAFEPLVIHDKGAILEVNLSFCQVCGYERDEVIGKPALELTAPESRDLVRSKIAAGDTLPYEGFALRKDGTTFPAQVAGRPVTYRGRAVRATAIRDLTESRQAEAQRLELALAQERTEILREFLNTISHDLKTPLSVINAATYLLERSADPEIRAAKSQVIKVQTALLGKFIEDMLTISRLEVMPEVRFECLAVNRLVQDMEISFRPIAEAKKLTVRLDLVTPSPLVLGSEHDLNRALINLVDNAMNYTPVGGTIEIKTLVQDGVGIEVRDNGIGIDEADLPYIFDRFYRADKARSGHIGGTGLGLAIVKKIIDIHRGSLEVTSTVGSGSTFRVRLPAFGNNAERM